MSYERFVGLRYLMAKRRSSVLSIITLISITGVALGVTALIVVLSVMGGFKKDLKEKILGTKAHIVVQALEEGEPLDDVEGLTQKARTLPRVVGVSAFVEAEVMVSSPTNLSGVILRGIEPEHIGEVSQLPEDMREGKLAYLRDAAPLMEKIESERDEEMQKLLDRVRSERREIEAERKKDEEKGPEPSVAPLDDESEEGGMPPLPHQEQAEQEGEESDDEEEAGAMPALPHQLEREEQEEQEEGAMPALPGQGGDEAEGPIDRKGPRIPGLVIGPELAKSLQVELGDEVNVVTPNAEMGPMGPIPRSRPFRIVGIFYSGMYEYDANFAYASLDDAMDFLSLDAPTGVELKTDNVETAQEVATALQATLGPSVDVLDWQEMNRSLFYALKLEKIAMFVVLTFIILVASFSIVAMLIMIVIEKGREIAVLKSMGATNGGVMRTFIFQGTVIGSVGAILGLLFGLAICWFLETVGFPLNSEVYYISTLPVDVDPVEIVLIVICAIVISLLATIYPSIQAARLNPVDGLRND